jgi:NAD-dependent deacetylase
MSRSIDPRKIVILSGAGLSAESGLPTFRDANGLWRQYAWHEVASPEGWRVRPEAVLEFYNERRAKAWQAQPNAAHRALASLEGAFEVVVITQNVDELHERAGSRHVIHLHGQLAYARCTSRARHRRRIDGDPIALGQACACGAQLRPDIVWFGEATEHMSDARQHVASAAKVLIVGTSLTVQPAASLVDSAPSGAEKVLVALDIDEVPHGYAYMRGKATDEVPGLVRQWLGDA